MDCSSGLSRLPNGSPYWTPTARRAAARPSSPPRAVAGPPQRDSAQRCAAALDLRRRVTDELGDASRSDDDRIDSRPLELVDLLASRHRHVGHRELSGRHVGEQLERAGERALVVVVPAGEEEDLRIEPLECELELFFVPNLDDAVQPEAQGLSLQALEPVTVLVQLVDDDQTSVGADTCGLGNGACRTPQNPPLRRLAHALDIAAHDECLRSLALGCPRRLGIVDLDDDGDSVPLGDCLAESARCHRRQRSLVFAHRYWPTGCQTVLSSRKAATSHGLWASASPWTTRLTFAAAARSSSGASPSAVPRSIALTSMCDASQGASSERWPVRMLTAPPGTSDVASASASSIAASGCVSDATATTAFPPVIAGTTRETIPSSGGSSGASVATTPVGSGTVKLKYGPATGFDEPSTCASLSAQPAYQTTRSIVCSTSSLPLDRSANSAARASIISARR